MPTVNLDALIVREDFQVIGDGDEVPEKPSIGIRELDKGEFFSAGLRKPDFQRETAEWDSKRVVGLIKTFVEDQLIPSVILWKNKDLLFVIDGSHRLSALIAWVQDDYGDGTKSKDFFGPSIPEDQIKMADKTRELVKREIGSYADHRNAVLNPESYGPDVVARAKRLSTLTLKLQWVRGDATKAEDSFARINQQAATITPQEMELIAGRRKPTAIAARAVIKKGAGHQYWQSFSEANQRAIKEHASELHGLIFSPVLRYPIKTLDLPSGGAVSAPTALRMVYDFISLAVGSSEKDEDDLDGAKTIKYLVRAKRVAILILDNNPASLGLHPAVYFYSWTGKHIPVMFLSIADLTVRLERMQSGFKDFIAVRKTFEEFLVANRTLQNQIIRKYGATPSGRKHLLEFYVNVLQTIADDAGITDITSKLQRMPSYTYLQPSEAAYEGVTPTRFSTQVRSGIVVQELLTTSHRCPICESWVPTQAISVDHKIRRIDGGKATDDNGQLTHPYCNTGFKEGQHARLRISEGAS